MRDLVATLPHQLQISSITWKIKHFYDSCMALDNIERDDKSPVQKIITELGISWFLLFEIFMVIFFL